MRGRTMALCCVVGSLAVASLGCNAGDAASSEGAGFAVHAAPLDYGQLSDAQYLSSSFWDDGKAEIAFYSVERQINHYGEERPQSFLVGTYLVKHDFDRSTEAKARDGADSEVVESAFKWAAFYEFESDNSYQYKRAYVVNASQRELRPFKQSFTSFDWCSNQYRELSFRPDGSVRRLLRSDDYGNVDEVLSSDSSVPVIPAALVPLWVRALDFGETETLRFAVQAEDGTTVSATARLIGRESMSIAAIEYQAEKIQLDYEEPAQSIFASRRRGSDRQETYWRAAEGERLLLRLDAETYRMELVEAVRSAYWSENVYDALRHVRERP